MTRIRAHRAATQAWLLDGAVAAYADFVLAETETVRTFSPYSGFGFTLITLATAVVGGLGKLFSTMAGAVIVGIVLTFTGGYINSSYEPAFSFAILALVVLFRPHGLFTTTRRSALE